jgi:hypothetical protein
VIKIEPNDPTWDKYLSHPTTQTVLPEEDPVIKIEPNDPTWDKYLSHPTTQTVLPEEEEERGREMRKRSVLTINRRSCSYSTIL